MFTIIGFFILFPLKIIGFILKLIFWVPLVILGIAIDDGSPGWF